MMFVDMLSLATYNEETAEICCPNCGSWTYVDDLKPDGDGFATCPLCRDDGK